MIAEPPFEAGAFQVSVTLPLPAVAAVEGRRAGRGRPGWRSSGFEAEPVPTALVAVTVKV